MRSVLLISVTLVVVGLASVAFGSDVPAGQTAFLENKCNTCHSVDSAEIAKKSEKMKGPDLSNAGAEVKSAEWLKGFLLKTEKLDEKAHKKTWKGTDEQLDAIVKWMMSLKKS
jgi:mono/diheme cytochrome c family protein